MKIIETEPGRITSVSGREYDYYKVERDLRGALTRYDVRHFKDTDWVWVMNQQTKQVVEPGGQTVKEIKALIKSAPDPAA